MENKAIYDLVHMVGALYESTDMALFQLFKNKNNSTYLLVIVIQINEIEEKIYIYDWYSVPKYIYNIYIKLCSYSNIEFKDNLYILYGPHLNKKKNL